MLEGVERGVASQEKLISHEGSGSRSVTPGALVVDGPQLVRMVEVDK